MQDPARKLSTGEGPAQELGRVILAGEGSWVVRAASGDHRARRAVSCLVEPEPGDRVLLLRGEEGESWILAILERGAGAPVQIAADGDLSLRLADGRFSVAAKGIDLVASGETSVVAGGVHVTSAEGKVHLDRLSFLGGALHAELGAVKLFAGFFDSVLDRLSQKVKRSYRQVEEMDHLRAEQIDWSARENMVLKGHNALVTAEELVKVDAEQIHLG